MDRWTDGQRQKKREMGGGGQGSLLKGNILNVALMVLIVATDEDIYPKVRPVQLMPEY